MIYFTRVPTLSRVCTDRVRGGLGRDNPSYCGSNDGQPRLGLAELFFVYNIRPANRYTHLVAELEAWFLPIILFIAMLKWGWLQFFSHLM